MKVLIAGTFDLFHKGHEHFIYSSFLHTNKNDEFHVIISTDKSVQKIKNKIPIHTEKQRQQQVEDFLSLISPAEKNITISVHIGDEIDFLKLPKKISPHLICLGYDQKIPKSLHEELQNCLFKRINPYFPNIYKTSILQKKEEKKSIKTKYKKN